MRRRQFTVGLFGIGLAPLGAYGFSLTQGDASLGVRTALERGAKSAVALLGRTDGFLANPLVRIGLPGSLENAAKLLKLFGQGYKVDDLVTGMNRAAEAAVPLASELLVGAARDISVEDAIKIVRGGDTSVTDYFARSTREPLTTRFLPIVTRETEKLALSDKFNAVAARASSFGLVKKDEANLQQYVTGKALDGLYLMIGEEERKIRRDPIGTGSDILRRVFGG